jgi:hypothetical protein
MARYGRGAQKSVKSAMRRRKKGTLRSGKGGKGGQVKKQEAGDRDLGCQKRGRKAPRFPQEIKLTEIRV